MKQHKTWIGLVLLALYLVQPVNASCAPPAPPRENLQHSDAVFSGEVVGIGGSNLLTEFFGGGYFVTFRVLESWKGVNTTSVTLKGDQRTSIDYPFAQGQQYLVYAYYEGGQQSGALTTNACNGTKELASAQADLQVLGRGSISLQPATANNASSLALMLAASSILLVSISTVFFLWWRRRRT